MKLFQGDIVWVSFPFTDGRTFKERPALVISKSDYNQTSLDILLCYITSRKNSKHVFQILNNDVTEGELYKQSFIRYDKILLIDKKRILGIIAVVKDSYYRKVARKICNFIQLPKK